jgi:S-formylglutathione hydrolase FrmB
MSTAMHKIIKCIVITPDSYQITSRRYPVIYLLHGHSADYTQWISTAPQLQRKADEYQAIIICPDGGYNSWYLDSEKDTTVKYETFITNELIAFTDASYRTIAKRESRAIAGLSMGGHGALYLAIRHRKIYGAAGSTSGGVDLTPFPNNWEIKNVLGEMSSNSDAWKKNSVINLVNVLKDNELAIMIDCGLDDFFLDANCRLHKKLIELNISHDYIVRPGSHDADYWSNSIDYQLLFFNKFFSK